MPPPASLHSETKLRIVSEHAPQWKILMFITLAHVWISLGAYSLPPLAAFMQADLVLTRAQFGTFISAWSLGALLASVPAGWLGRRIGGRRTMVLGQTLLGVSIIGVSQLDSYPLAVAAMFLTGVGYGAVSPVTSQVVMVHFSSRLRATAMGFKQMGVPLGSFVAAGVAPIMAVWAGWRAALALGGALAVVTSVLIYLFYPNSNDGRHLTAQGSRPGLRWLLRRDLMLTYLIGLLLAGAQVATITYLALFLHEVGQLTIVVAGSYVALMQISAVVGRVGWGAVSDRLFNGRRKFVFGLVSALAASVALAMSQVDSLSPGWLIAALSLGLGVAIVGWSGVYLALIAELATADLTGIATGVSAIFTYLGVVILPPLFGYLVDQTGTYDTAWTLTAIIVLFSIGLLFRVRETPAVLA